MGLSEEQTPREIRLEHDWYSFTADPASKIRIWNQMLDEEEFMMHKYPLWRHWDEFTKEDVRRRTKALMKTMILRACGYVATDFEDSPNNFYRGPPTNRRCL